MAKRITDEDLRLNLIVNGDGGRKEMLALDRQIGTCGLLVVLITPCS